MYHPLTAILLIASTMYSCVSQSQQLNTKDWKTNYASLPFWDSSIKHNGTQGYMDTCTVHNTPVRIIHNDTLFDGSVQVFKKGEWVDNIIFDNLGNHNDYDLTRDFNNDGNNDLIFYWKWFGQIYFFDRATNSFSDTINCTLERDWHQLDTKHNLYFENNFGKLIHSPVQSNLLTFVHMHRVEIAHLLMYFDDNYNSKSQLNLIKLELYKAHSKVPVDSFSISKPVLVDDFDLTKFWKIHMNKFLTNKLDKTGG